MHPRIAELIKYVDDQTEELRTAYESVPAERRAIRPHPDRWSPAEVVHHLVIVDGRVVMRIQSLIEQARTLEPEQDDSSILATFDVASVVARDRRIRASDASTPRDTNAATVWSDFEAVRRRFKEVLATADGLALGRVTAPHPALGEISAYEWIAFVGSHAGRHASQIREDAALQM
jgi:hypothetical protein